MTVKPVVEVITPSIARPVVPAPITPGGAWSPLNISGLRGWYDASDAGTITVETGVSRWEDKSPLGYDLLQVTASNQPDYVTGVRDHINFPAGAIRSMGAIYGAAYPQPLWCVVLYQQSISPAVTPYPVLMNHKNPFGPYYTRLQTWDGEISNDEIGITSFGSYLSTLAPDFQIHAFGVFYNTVTSYIKIDNVVLPPKISWSITAQNSDGFVLGCLAPTGAGQFYGKVFEIIIAGHAPTEQDEDDLWQYLVDKWSL